jgi:hypothetical protein
LDVATIGIVVPAAIAQHHSKLEPWEVCNRDLLHGAIFAYYRSPFPNVGAAANAINNLEILRDRDPEAFGKRGVVYMNPWTAKHIAITDCDGDHNGFFVGYLANDNLPRQLRERLSSLSLVGGDRYEAGREVITQIILQPDLEHGEFPLSVKEFIEANAPLENRKPLPIAKNLQTAVDTAKSSVGIDETIHAFGELIQYKSHQLRQNVKKPDIYLTRDLPTNTQEPIGWAVETANRFYDGGRQQPELQEIESDNLNKRFRSLIPITHNDAQKAVVDEFAKQYRNCTNAIGGVKERLYQELPEDQQPTLTIASSSGRSLVVQRLCDADFAGDSPVWDLVDGESNARFEIYRNRENDGKAKPRSRTADRSQSSFPRRLGVERWSRTRDSVRSRLTC